MILPMNWVAETHSAWFRCVFAWRIRKVTGAPSSSRATRAVASRCPLGNVSCRASEFAKAMFECDTQPPPSAYWRNMAATALENATDESLMIAYAEGDAQAFRLLFARLAPRIHAFFRRSLGDAAAADDLLQATFLRIHRSRDRYRSEFPVRVWVFTIAARARLDEFRRRYRLPEEAGEKELEKVANAGCDERGSQMDAGEGKELAGRVRAAVDQLPETQRVVVHLNRFEGLTFVQIAHVLGTTEGAVKLRAFRAYERLRQLLRECSREEAAQ